MISEKTVSRSDDGEFELILGNKQLLSVFFIVVVLLGVFFTMGYIVGKNAVTGTELAGRKADPIVVDPSKPSSFGSELKPVAAASTTPADTSAAKPKEEDARDARRQDADRKEAERRAEADRKAESERVEAERRAEAERQTEAKRNEPKETAARPVGVAPTLQAGQQFLQVVASSKPDCEIIADVLRRKGFAAAVVAGPTEKVFRVVVGPLADTGAITRTRTELEAAGFQKPVLKKF